MQGRKEHHDKPHSFLHTPLYPARAGQLLPNSSQFATAGWVERVYRSLKLRKLHDMPPPPESMVASQTDLLQDLCRALLGCTLPTPTSP